jgi:hypothetical protein
MQQILFLIDNFLRECIKSIDINSSNFNPFFDLIIYMHKNIEPELYDLGKKLAQLKSVWQW